MKKIFIAVVVFIPVLVFVVNTYAQDLKIIDVKGEVFLRQREIMPWRKAKVAEPLYKDYELQTKKGSECTLSFGEGFNRIILKDNSQLKIADVLGVSLLLSKGRVFSLIEKIEKEEVFQIKTPTAVAGPRGTGWIVTFLGGTTFVLCLEGVIYVGGLDEQGNIISLEDMGEGFGVEVFEGGQIGDFFPLRDEDEQEWNEFIENLGDLEQTPEAQTPFDIRDRDLRDEQRDDFREERVRELRQQQETSSSGDGQDIEGQDIER